MASSSKRKRTSLRGHKETFAHDKHGPHRGGTIVGWPDRFPREEYKVEGSNADNLEVVGLDNFVHVRCPWSSSKPCLCGRYSCHLDSMIIAVDGACPGNGTDQATASGCGVYFGPESADDQYPKQNMSFAVFDHRHTSQRAELHAAIAAMHSAIDFATNGGQWPCDLASCKTPCRLRHLVIKTDSAYMVNAMTGTVLKWLQNGWSTVKKEPVKNKDLWEDMVIGIQALHALEVNVSFWLVPREQNK